MGFHEHASSEASALIGRLQASCAEKSHRQLRAFRDALDAAMRTVETAVEPQPPIDHDEHLKNLVERLTEAAATHARDLVERANAKGQAAVDSIEAALEERIRENEELAHSLSAIRAQMETLRSEIESEMIRARTAESERAKIEQARAQAESAWIETEAALQRETASRASIEVQLQETRNALEAARLEVAASTKVLEQEAAERARLTASLVKLPPQPLDALLMTFQTLATATTVDDVLVALVAGLASDFSRVALFRVKEDRLEGVQHLGLSFDRDIATAVFRLSEDSLLTQAVNSGCVEGFAAADLADGRAPFDGSPAFILTLPILIRGEALAVIYADDAGRTQTESSSGERSVKFAQLLLSHATPLLTRLSTNLVALTELRQYATMLVNEIEHIYSADAGAGKHADELQSRLRENLQCARQIYAQRVTPEGPFAATLLEEQLALQAQSGTPFGRDVAAVLERSQPASALEAVS
jgi:hypothetical protein